jgi:serine/threonine protein kinase
MVTGRDISSLQRGKILYKAPELRGPGTFALESDMWSFGCLMFDVSSTGKRTAFEFDKDLDDYVNGVVTEPPQLVQADNKALTSDDLQYFNGIIRECLSINPNNRPSAESLLEKFKFRFSATSEGSDEDEQFGKDRELS